MSDHRDAWTAEGEYYEYGKAANPIGAGLIPKVPMGDFPASLHQDGPSRIIPTYLRTLDIHFVHKNSKVYIA